MITLRTVAGHVVVEINAGAEIAESELTPQQAEDFAASLRRMAYEARTGAGQVASLDGLIRKIGRAPA